MFDKIAPSWYNFAYWGAESRFGPQTYRPDIMSPGAFVPPHVEAQAF